MSTTSVSSLGIGTGVDLQNMLTKIMEAERTPLKALDSKITSTNSKISLFGSLNAKLDALKSAAETLAYPSRMSAVKASSSDTASLTATAAFNATVGMYETRVTQLAYAQKSFSAEYATGTTFSAGELKFTVGSNPETTVNVADGATLSDVAASINNAKIGVRATVVTTSSGAQRMVMTGDATGAGKGFTLTSTATASGAQASLADFDTTTPGLARTNAQNALMTVDGIEVSSSTNTFTGAVTGLTLTAVAVQTQSSTVTVKNDPDTIVNAAKAFVEAFNEVAKLIKDNASYNASTKTAGGFNGDNVTRSVLSMLGNVRTSIPTSLSGATLQSLSSIGIQIQQDGKLKLDTSKLTAEISNAPAAVTSVLQAYGTKYAETVTSMQSTTGIVGNRISSLKNTLTRFNENRESLELRMELVEKRYRAQFTALDKYVSSMQTTSGYLGQQLATLSASSS